MNDMKNILRQLKTGLKEMNKAKKAQDHIVGELISTLPEDKRKEANALLIKARKGKTDITEIMNFAGNMRKEDKENLEKAVEKVDKKTEEVKDK